MENSSRNFPEIFIFQVVTQSVLLENSSKRKDFVENNISRILGRHTGRFTGNLIQTKCYKSYMVSVKTVCVPPQNWKNWISTHDFLMDEFSSKTVCVTTRKMKISEIFLEFSMSFPWFANKGYIVIRFQNWTNHKHAGKWTTQKFERKRSVDGLKSLKADR